jgi:CRISPR-associated protein Csb2
VLALRCALLRDTFEAERADAPGLPEWPPSWMRLYSALVSVAHSGGPEDGVLRELERAQPPEVRVSPRADALPSRRTAYVPTNARHEPAHSVLPARTNATRTWARVAPRHAVVFFVWPELELDPDERSVLVELCRRVPYFGRTTSPALIDVIEQEQLGDPGWCLVPRRKGIAGVRFVAEETMRVPFPGALEQLRQAHEAKYARGEPGDSWQIGAWTEYGHNEPAEPEPERELGPIGRMAVMAIEGRVVDGRLATRITAALRRAIRSRADTDIAPIHGHHSGDTPQCCFLALPFVGSRHADGHLLGLAVAFPRRLGPLDAAVVERAIPRAGEQIELRCGPLGVLRLRRLAPLDLPRSGWGLRPERWSGPARRWATAYPIVFDRYLKPGDDPEAELRRTVERSGYPAPAEIVSSRYPLVPGALDLTPADTIRRKGVPGFKPYKHAVLRFERTLQGPLAIGSMRHYGLGLCVPLDDGLSQPPEGAHGA